MEYSMEAADGEIGSVSDFYFSDDTWAIRYMVVDTGPWLFGRRVLISPMAFKKPVHEDRTFHVDLTKEQVKNSPDIDLDKPVSRQQETALHDYYLWRYYWVTMPSPMPRGTSPGAVTPVPVNEQSEAGEPPRLATTEPGAEVINGGDPHLRSMREVIGYHIQTTDGEIGHVEDSFVDDAGWQIRYILVDTRNWLPGRKVLIAPEWIEGVSWSNAVVTVNLTRQQVEESPEYEYKPERPPQREYEARLYRHYGAPYYWT